MLIEGIVLFLPALAFFGLAGGFFCWFKRQDKKWSPAITDDYQRPPGESLRLKLEDLLGELMLEAGLLLTGALFPLFLLFVSESLTVRYTVVFVALCSIMRSGFVLHRIIKNIRSYSLGFRGERYTAIYLQPLVKYDYHIFHDVQMEGYNVDHVLVGPGGVYAIETKARRKRSSAGFNRAEVSYDGKTLKYPEVPPETYGLEAAISRADGLQQWLSSAVGEAVPVKPILTLPGWKVTYRGHPHPPVMNPKSIANYVRKYAHANLASQLIQRINHQIAEKQKLAYANL